MSQFSKRDQGDCLEWSNNLLLGWGKEGKEGGEGGETGCYAKFAK